MFALHRKSLGPSAAELLEATRKEYVKTEALKNAKIGPGRPRIFSHYDSGDEEKNVSSSQVCLRRRVPVQPSKSPNLTCFCITSTPRIRPSNYKPLETPYGAFHRVDKQPTLSRAKSTPPRVPPHAPPPRPPKPSWLKKSSLARTSDEPNEDISQAIRMKPVPAPRASKQNSMRRQTMTIAESCMLSKKESNATDLCTEFDELRVSSYSADGNVVTSKTMESLTTTPSTSRGTMSPYGGRCTRVSTRESLQNIIHSTSNFTSPDSDSGLHHSSVESLDNPYPLYTKAISKGIGSNNGGLAKPQFTNNRQDKGFETNRIFGSVMSENNPVLHMASDGNVEEGSTSLDMSQIGSDASIFTSITAACNANSSSACPSRGSTECGEHMVGGWSRFGAEPSLIEKNARVIKWIYSCRAAVA